MVMLTVNELKIGTKVILDNDPYSIVENEYVKPGKGQAFNRIKLRNVKSGRILDKTFKSGEMLEIADVVDIEMQYLYNDGIIYNFMSCTTFEQFAVNKNVIGTNVLWLKEQDICIVTVWNGDIIGINPPIFVVLKVIDTDPGLRGDTATGGSKSATLETGAVVRVPLFVNIGDALKIDTRNGSYITRIKLS